MDTVISTNLTLLKKLSNYFAEAVGQKSKYFFSQAVRSSQKGKYFVK